MGIKDKLVSKGAEKVINSLFEDIGKISDLAIDSKNKAIRLVVDLKGETRPLSLDIREYEILEEGSHYFIIVHRFSSSRDWMNTAFEKFFKGMKLPIPDKYGFVIKQTL